MNRSHRTNQHTIRRTLLAVSVLSLLVTSIPLGESWAWFTDNTSSGLSAMKTASFDIQTAITPLDPSSSPIEPIQEGLYSLAPGAYTVTVSRDPSSTASTGYCTIQSGSGLNGYTDPLNGSLTLTLEVPDNEEPPGQQEQVRITPSWGTFGDAASTYAQTEALCLEEGMIVNTLGQVLTELTEPEVTEPEVTEPEVTEPEITEPEATEPEATEPEATEPEATEPEATQPEVTEPETTEPEATEPEATEPEATEPEITEPEITEPEVTEPEATEPEATEPEVTEPEATEPEATEPEVTQPEVTEPEATEPEATETEPEEQSAEPRIHEIPNCYQSDYADIPYGDGTIADSGSGIVALSMAASYMTGYGYTPDMLAAWFGSNGDDEISRLETAADTLMLPWTRTENLETAAQAAAQGKLLILRLENDGQIPCPFTSGVHFILIRGMNEEGRYLVNDPDKTNYEKEELLSGFESGFSLDAFQGICTHSWILDPDSLGEGFVPYTQ